MKKIILSFAILVLGLFVFKTDAYAREIYGNGTGGIYIDIEKSMYKSDQYNYLGNAYTNQGCTWFVGARIEDLTGKQTRAAHDGVAWYEKGRYQDYGFSIGVAGEIRAHSIACYKGHVAIVEAVNGDNAIISEGGYINGSDANGYCRITSTSIYNLEHPTDSIKGDFLGYVYFDDGTSTTPSNPPTPVTYNPQGSVDTIWGEAGAFNISGWAFDKDDISAALEIRAYVGGEAGSGASYYSTTANVSRPDVDEYYHTGTNHGFGARFETDLTGDFEVYIYAINVGGGADTLLNHSFITIIPEWVPCGYSAYKYGNSFVYFDNYRNGYFEATIDDENMIVHLSRFCHGENYSDIIIPAKCDIGRCTYDVEINCDHATEQTSRYSFGLNVGNRSIGPRSVKFVTVDGQKVKAGNDLSGLFAMDNVFSTYSNLKEVDLSGLDTSRTKGMNSLFYKCNMLERIDMQGLNTENVIDMSEAFSGCERVNTIDLTDINTRNVVDMSEMFFNCNRLSEIKWTGIDTSSVTNMRGMFRGTYNLSNIDLSSFNTAKVENMSYMFTGSGVKTIDVSGFNTTNVTDMESMFESTNLKKIDISNFDTSKVDNMKNMFAWHDELKEIILGEIDTSNVTDTSGMFLGCVNLFYIDLNHFDTGNVNNMSQMFSLCEKLEKIDVSRFDTAHVNNFSEMFLECSRLEEIDISSFDMSSAVNCETILLGCENLKKIKLPNKINSNLKIELPFEMYDNYGNSVNIIDISRAGETLYCAIPSGEYYRYDRTENQPISSNKYKEIQLERDVEQITFNIGIEKNIAVDIPDKYIQKQASGSPVGTKAVLLHYNVEADNFTLTDNGVVVDCNVTFSISEGANYALVYAINGDTTNDGLVDIEDLLNVLYHSSKRKTMSPLNVGIADTNGDNEVDIEDVLATLYYTSGRRSRL